MVDPVDEHSVQQLKVFGGMELEPIFAADPSTSIPCSSWRSSTAGCRVDLPGGLAAERHRGLVHGGPVVEYSVQRLKALDGMGLEPTFAEDPIDESRAAVEGSRRRGGESTFLRPCFSRTPRSCTWWIQSTRFPCSG